MPANLVTETASAQPRASLDETTFQQLLQAAYVIQQHNETLPVESSYPNAREILAKVVATHELLQSAEFDLVGGMRLIAERLRDATRARGVAIAVKQQNCLQYCTSSGSGVSAAGSRVAIDLNSSDPASESSVGSASDGGQPSVENEIKSLVVIPLHYEGKVAGVLEARFSEDWNEYQPDLEACELMAGLATEVITRAVGREWKEVLAAERATMMQSLEKIKPQLERLASANSAVSEDAAPDALTAPSPALQPAAASCSSCGYRFTAEEQFCGNCGSPRSAYEPAVEAGSPILQDSPADQYEPHPELLSMSATVPSAFSSSAESGFESPSANRPSAFMHPPSEATPVLGTEEENILATPESAPSPWTSARTAHRWLDSLQAGGAGRNWLSRNRANIYLAAAILLLLLVLSGWGTRHAHYASPKTSQPQLTLGERLLISLGLAEAPSAPVNLGNPNIRVWVDLHTALYYCPGAELYGKSEGGKFTTQKDAQQDQFQPADGAACD